MKRIESLNLLEQIQAAQPSLRPSEQRVAQAVLAHPRRIVNLSIAVLAQEVGVSEPTVMRFCRAVGCKGFQAFKLRLAEALSAGLLYLEREVSIADDIAAVTDKVLESAIVALVSARQSLDSDAMKQAVDLLLQARRVNIYGLGGAGIVAADAQLKFCRLGLAAVAYSDAYLLLVAARLLQPGDVVLAISNSGRSVDLLRSVELAQAAGAAVIAITAEASPLARQAQVCLVVTGNNIESDAYAPIKARIAPMVAIDALAINTALRLGPMVLDRLQQAQAVLDDKFSAL